MQFYTTPANLILVELFFFIFYLSLFILGINVGSFLNVLIDRLPRGEQVLKGRSHCDNCKHKLSWYDLIPIFSWLTLRGRCRYCHSPIGVQYPFVELLTGVLFSATFLLFSGQNYESPLRQGFAGQVGIMNQELWGWVTFLYYIFIISALIVIFFADLKYQIIPDQIVYPTIIVSLSFLISQYPNIPISYLVSALSAGLFFLAVVLATRGRGMGMGDVKLAILMGLILGFPKIIVALYLAFLTGAAVGVILILTGKKKFGQHIPFGPFLTGSTLISFWWGEKLWQILLKVLGL